jgi:signal transduction histidine kinase
MADRRVAVGELGLSSRQRQHLLEQVVSAREQERQRIAQGIHDDAVQVMSAANIRLVMLGRKLDGGPLSAELDSLIEAVSVSTARLRDLLFDLRPPELERSGLCAALQVLLDNLTRDAHLVCALQGELVYEPAHDRAVLVYRIVQEALVNVRKHASARHVRLDIRTERGGVMVGVHDDGRGFDPGSSVAAAPGHIGAASMSERADLAGGWCQVTSAPGTGTSVELWVPSTDDLQSAQEAPP